MSIPLRLLLLEDNDDDANLILRELRRADYVPESRRVDNEVDFLAALDPPPQLILANYQLAGFGVSRALEHLRTSKLELPLIIISNTVGDEIAAELILDGAADYVLMARLARLGPAVAATLERQRLRVEQRETLQKLAANELRFRGLIEHSLDAIVLLSVEGIVRYASPATTRVLGRRADGWEGRPWLNRVHPDDQERMGALFGRLAQEPGGTITAQFRFQHIDGTWRWLEAVGSNQLAEPGIEAIVGNFRDISEQRRAQDALQASESRYRALTEHSTDGLSLLSADGTILFRSPSNERIIDIPAAAALGTKVFERIHPDDLPRFQEQFNVLVQRPGASLNLEYRYQHRNGTWRWLDSVYTNLLDEPNVQAVVVNFRDSTERKVAGAQIAFQASLLDQVRNAVITVDLAGRIIYWNKHAETMYQWTSVEAIGHTLLELAVMPQTEGEVKEIIAAIQRGGFWEGELLVQRKDGRTFPALVVNTLIHDADGAPIAVVGVSYDITLLRLAEEELRHRLAELEAIHHISEALREAQTVDTLLSILLDETLAALAFPTGSIWLYTADTDRFALAAHRGPVVDDADTLHKGQGILGYVVESGENYFTPDFQSDSHTTAGARRAFPEGTGGIFLPIRAPHQIVGVLVVQVQAPRTFTDSEVRLLATLADMAGIAVHRTQQLELTEQQVERLNALHTINQAIGGSLDLPLVLNLLLEQVIVQTHVDAAVVLLLDSPAGSLRYAAARGFRGRQVEQATFRVGQGLAGRVAAEQRVIKVSDLSAGSFTLAQAHLLADEGFASACGVPLLAKGRVRGVLQVFQRSPLDLSAEALEFLEALAAQAAIAIDNSLLFADLQRSASELFLAYETTLEGWSRALDLRDKETEGHTLRVTALTERLAAAMGLRDEELVYLRRGALLHDIGKMGVPDGILLKPGALTDEEWRVMRMHPTYAYELLAPIAFLRSALDIPYCHHEKWDGTGYPRGLSGEQIPLAARIFAVTDVWDALRSDRPYRAAWPEAKVRAHIQSLSGTHFDPKVVEAFMRLEL